MLSITQNEDNNDIHTSQWQGMLNVFESQWNEIICKQITVSTNHVNAEALTYHDKHLQGIINKLVQGVGHIKNIHVKYYNGSSNNMFDEFTSKKIAELELMKPSDRRGVNVNSSGNVNMKQQRTFLKQSDNDNNDYQSNSNNKVTIDDLIIQQQQQMKPKQKLQHVFESVGETMPNGVFSNTKRNGSVKKKRNLFLSNDNNNNINCNNHNKYNNSISNLNTQQHNRHKSFLKEDEPKIEKKKKTMAADKIGLHPLNTTTTTTINHPPIIKTKTTTNIKHRLTTHTSSSSTPNNNTGSRSERSSKIRKKIQHNTQLISDMMKLNNK